MKMIIQYTCTLQNPHIKLFSNDIIGLLNQNQPDHGCHHLSQHITIATITPTSQQTQNHSHHPTPNHKQCLASNFPLIPLQSIKLPNPHHHHQPHPPPPPPKFPNPLLDFPAPPSCIHQPIPSQPSPPPLRPPASTSFPPEVKHRTQDGCREIQS